MKQILFLLLLCLFACQTSFAQAKKQDKKYEVRETITTVKGKDGKYHTVKKRTYVLVSKNEAQQATQPKTKTSNRQKKTTETTDTLQKLAETTIKPTQTAQTPYTSGGYLCNPPLPYMPQSLNILFIGNSFAIDTSTALPEIFKSMGVSNVNVYVLYKGGCSMKQHYNYFKSGEKAYELWQYNINNGSIIDNACSIRDVMKRTPYDIVIFQQYSLESGDYTTYEPYLSRLIQAYNLVKLSPRTTFAFNQTWSYSANHKKIAVYKTPYQMWQRITESCRKMKLQSGIDLIIPCGTAVENARACNRLLYENNLTRDNQHIDLYEGRYLLACTFFESIIAPCLALDIRNDKTVYGPSGAMNQVNSSNRQYLQNCARLAVANNYEVSEFVNEQ